VIKLSYNTISSCLFVVKVNKIPITLELTYILGGSSFFYFGLHIPFLSTTFAGRERAVLINLCLTFCLFFDHFHLGKMRAITYFNVVFHSGSFPFKEYFLFSEDTTQNDRGPSLTQTSTSISLPQSLYLKNPVGKISNIAFTKTEFA
jgi:hypothetical protein